MIGGCAGNPEAPMKIKLLMQREFVGRAEIDHVLWPSALRRLRDSYLMIQAGKPAKDATEILAQVEDALQYAEKSKT